MTTKTPLPARPVLTAETLTELITAAGVPCVTLVDDDAAAAAIPARPQDEGLRIVRGSMPVRICYPIPPKADGEDRFHAALARKDSHVLWLYDWVGQYRWSADSAGPHADPWITVSPVPLPATYTDGQGREISRATGSPVDDPAPVTWLTLTAITDPAAYAAWIEADVAADVKGAGKLRASREYMGSFRLAEAGRIRAAGRRAYVDHTWRHGTARDQAEARVRDLGGAGQPGIVHSAAPVTGYASCTTCLWPVFEAAGRWWRTNGDCPGPRKIRDLPTEPGDWEFGAIYMICGYCGSNVSWPELLKSWVRLTGAWLLGVALVPPPGTDMRQYSRVHQPGQLVVLAETEGIAARPGQRGILPHYCPEIPDSVKADYAPEVAAAARGPRGILAGPVTAGDGEESR